MKNFFKRISSFKFQVSNLISFFILVTICSCRNDVVPESQNDWGYPKDVANIMLNKCATAGCHNTQSAQNANGLDFSTWDNMFKGGRNGSSVIPYSVDYSYMLYSVNTFSDLGVQLAPTMPLNQAALTRDEVMTLRNWVASGAPNDKGFVKFSDNPNRKKIYVCMQGCDQVAVFDAATKVIMRYIKVGRDDAAIESPHQVRITPDGRYWCVVFVGGDIVQVFNTSDDSHVADISIGAAQWNTIVFTPDSKTAFVCATLQGLIKRISLETMLVVATGGGVNPHGSYITKDGAWMYVTSQSGHVIYKYDIISDLLFTNDPINLNVGIDNTARDPHEIIFLPDESQYFVSCQKSNEIRIFLTSDNSLLAAIDVGAKPQEMSLSPSHGLLFVTCTEDSLISGAGSNNKGSVYIINYTNYTKVDSLYPGYQPHGIAVDEDHNCVYVANLNYDGTGPAPHHVTSCGNRDGYLSIINMNTMQLFKSTNPDGTSYIYKNELLYYPYFVTYRK